MTAAELLRSCRLQEAIDAQIQEVRNNPGDAAGRLFLFEMLAYAGDLDRARKQIDALSSSDPETAAGYQTYRQLLDAEQKRREVLDQGAVPHFFQPPPEHVRLRLEALLHLREGRPEDASAALTQANANARPVAGKLNGTAFESMRDCDDLFGTVLEVMARGLYCWVPLEQITAVRVGEPKAARDTLWIPAHLELATTAGEVFLPALYPGSHQSADNHIKLGRVTDWKTLTGGAVLGQGLHLYIFDTEDHSLLDWRELALST